MKSSNQKGNTMLEALSALAIVTVLGIAGIGLISNLFDLFKQNMVVSEVQEIQKNVSARFRLEGNYSGLEGMSAQKMRDELLVPFQMLVNGKIVHRLNGEVAINVSTLGDEYFDITFDELSLRSCMNLSQINWSGSQTSDLFQLKINDKVFKLPIGEVAMGAENALPITVKKATSSCKAGKDNTIIWTFQ